MLKPAQRASRRGYRRILWPTDFSPSSRTALRHLLQVADDGAEVIVMHLFAPTLVHARAGSSLAGGVQADVERRDSARQDLRKLIREIESDKPGVRARGLLVRGVASQHIPQIAKQLEPDLIVLPVAAPNVADVLLRTTAERVLRDAPCPVLAVPVREG